MTKTSTLTPRIHIGHTDPDGEVVVHAGDDRFLFTVQEAVNACGMWNKMAEFQGQMKLLTERLEGWVAARKNAVKEAFLTVKAGGGLLFLVVMAGREYDAVLESDLTELDIEVANHPEFNLLRLNVLAIPDSTPECVEAFLTHG